MAISNYSKDKTRSGAPMAPSKKKPSSGKAIQKSRVLVEEGNDSGEERVITPGPSQPPAISGVLNLGAGSDDITGSDGEYADWTWREEMREELRTELRQELHSEIRNAMQEVMGESSSVLKRPREIDSEDVVESGPDAEVLKRIEESNRSNKFAIRLAAITKDGNKCQFSEMVDLREYLVKADGILQDPEKMQWDDVFAARDAIAEATKLVDNRMKLIERIDAHPLSWPVATEYQKLKKAKEGSGSAEDEKLFSQAEKNVADERKKREDRPKAGTSRSGYDRFHYSKRPGELLFCFVRLRVGLLNMMWYSSHSK